jgi:Sulfotransferase family
MISHKQRLIFVHIKSTGGCSIEEVLGIGRVFANPEQPDDIRHRGLGEYKQLFPDAFDDYFKFAFVRNPWDRLVSRYCRLRGLRRLVEDAEAAASIAEPREKNRILRKLARKRERNSTKYSQSSFSDWIETYVRKNHLQLHEGNVNMESAFDFIGRFERLHKDFETICQRLGLRASLPHVNRSEHAHYTQFYDERTRAIVAEMCGYDIDRFGYRFGE